MNTYLIYAKIAGSILIAAVVAMICWLCYDYGAQSVKADWEAERAAVNLATAEALTRMNAQREEVERELKIKEAAAWELYQNAQIESDKLNDELINRPWRVRIERAACTNLPVNTITASVGNATPTEYAELPAETARSIIKIGRDADQCEAKLKALQDYIETIKTPD